MVHTVIVLALLVLGPAPALAADTFHLKNGSAFEVDAWRWEGDDIAYQRHGQGQWHRIPKVAVERIVEGAVVEIPGRDGPREPPRRDVTSPTVSQASPTVPRSVVDEMYRLREAEAKAETALSEQQAIESIRLITYLRAGAHPAAAKRWVEEDHAKRREELQRIHEDARRRRLDFESQVRAQYGRLP